MMQISSLVKKCKLTWNEIDENNMDAWIEKWNNHQKQVEMAIYSKIKRYCDMAGAYIDSLPDDMTVLIK